MSEQLPDPSGVTTWPQAVVFITIVAAVAVVPSMFAYLNARAVKSTKHEVETVVTSITENNGGASVKDRFDKLDRTLAQLDTRIAAVEDRRTRRWFR